MPYHYKHFRILDPMLDSLLGYVNRRVPVGSFLAAVLENDLKGACEYADAENIANIPAFAAWLYAEAPSACWGSKEAVAAWSDIGRRELNLMREEVGLPQHLKAQT